MTRPGCIIAVIATVFLLAAIPLRAQQPPPGDSLAATLKPLLITALPAILYEKSDNWGHQAMVPVGVKWQGLKPEIQHSPRNHGTWKKMVITTQDLKRSLDLRIQDFKSIDAEKQSFKVRFAFQMGVRYDQQNWENGARLWSGSLQARAQVKLDLDCESTFHVDVGKDFLPDFVLRLRVTHADIKYDNLVVEHINGMGGSGAKLIGQAVHDCMRKWKPSIERDLLAKASAAVVKAADTKEVRVGFGSLLNKK
jgi:hypothetical protein